jgi:hypothetical protein
MSGGNSVEKLSAELSKKTVQMDMMETTLNKIKEELEQSRKLVVDLRKVGVDTDCDCLFFTENNCVFLFCG